MIHEIAEEFEQEFGLMPEPDIKGLGEGSKSVYHSKNPTVSGSDLHV